MFEQDLLVIFRLLYTFMLQKESFLYAQYEMYYLVWNNCETESLVQMLPS